MKALVLNGFSDDGATSDAMRATLADELRRRGWEQREFILRDEKLAYCTGCFGCWIKTPGECVINDAGREVTRAIVECDLLVYITPVTFGGYSSELKKALDRMIPCLSPFFIQIAGETHHAKRYQRYPRMLALGLLAAPDAQAAASFKTVHARNALNFHTPANAAGVVVQGASAEELRLGVQSLLREVELG